uniref:Uncharacterized protein n=1 Tax=Panagrolaimus sp. PS1159 TaxID=55785 RepID=A0AC35G6R8_9BILA
MLKHNEISSQFIVYLFTIVIASFIGIIDTGYIIAVWWSSKIFVKKDEKHSHMADVKTSQSEHSVNILGIFGTDGKDETKEQKAKREAFEENVQYSFIETKGGPDVRSILGAESEKSMMRMDNLVGITGYIAA